MAPRIRRISWYFSMRPIKSMIKGTSRMPITFPRWIRFTVSQVDGIQRRTVYDFKLVPSAFHNDIKINITKNSAFEQPFKVFLDSYQRNGIFKHYVEWVRHSFSRKLKAKYHLIVTLMESNEARPITLDGFNRFLMFVLCAWIFSFLVFLGELIYFKCEQRKLTKRRNKMRKNRNTANHDQMKWRCDKTGKRVTTTVDIYKHDGIICSSSEV